ncbi:hypothetical protein ACIQ64_08615 [Streptomyces sp. NPDC094473]|uniref:hypothetical protein n=1 Tax=Streptomyces sp. NPDC094473 TaxID=3366068 RepID=UPI00382A8727
MSSIDLHDEFAEHEDDGVEYLDCDLCEPTDDSEPYPYAHCCGCGADGSSERPDCTCE